ncbi:MAG TPA: tyrosine-type recombinase/integrase, partial [Casimicrobiaceae bacterium]
MATRNRKKLNPDMLRRAPVLTKRYRLWDTVVPGLFVSIAPTGIKSFNVQWARNSSKSIGKFPGMTLETARGQAHDILSDASKHGVPAIAKPTAKVPTFKAFIEQHYAPWVEAERKAGKATVANIKAQFLELFGTKPLTDITAWSIEKFKAARLKAGIKPKTVNRDLDRIRAALQKAVEWKIIAANPLSGVKDAKVAEEERVRFLNAEEEKRLREALSEREAERRRRRISGNAWAAARGRETRSIWAPDEYTDHLAPLVLLAMNTGLRRGELLGLTWEAVDRQRKQLRVSASRAKSAKVRHIPLNSEALEVIERLHKHSPTKTGLVFAGAKGAAMTHVKRSWASLMKAAKLNDFH